MSNATQNALPPVRVVQELSPTPAANPPGSAAGSAARRNALDGLSAEEQARRRAAIGRSGAGSTGRSGTGRSGPVANSRALSKPERKERREKWEAELLEVAARHEVTVKELLEKYPEKGEANIRKLLTHASSLKSSRKLTLRNALLHNLCLKSKEESSKYSLFIHDIDTDGINRRWEGEVKHRDHGGAGG